MTTPAILVVKPGTLSRAERKLLLEAGVVCVEADDPASVRYLSMETPPMDSNDLFRAAMFAIAENTNGGGSSGNYFAKHMAAMLKASKGVS